MNVNTSCPGAILAIFALLSLPAAAQVTPSQAASAPLTGTVVDAAGTPLGPFYATSAVLVPLAGQPVLLPVRQDLHATAAMTPAGNTAYVFFASDHCSGTAWLDRAAPVPGVSPASIAPSGDGDFVVYVPGNERAKTETYGSIQYVRGGKAHCQAGPGSSVLLRVEQVILLSTVYTAPYHLQ